MTTLFPRARTLQELEPLRRRDDLLRPGIDAICERHGLRGVDVTRFADGSLPVYALGELRVLKLYPPCHPRRHTTESSALERLEGALPVPTPSLEAVGTIDEWSYVVMSRLRGESLALAWPELSRAQHEQLASDLGVALAALHAIDVHDLAVIRPDWADFLERQRAACIDRQRQRSLADAWLAQIPDFLASHPLPESLPTFLHTEVMREHLLVQRTEEGVRLSGLFDFEPSMIGAAEYELASVGVFFTGGDAPLLRRLLLAYGHAPAALDDAMSQRLMTYALLHRYSNLRWYLERVPPAAGVDRLESLARQWFGAG